MTLNADISFVEAPNDSIKYSETIISVQQLEILLNNSTLIDLKYLEIDVIMWHSLVLYYNWKLYT